MQALHHFEQLFRVATDEELSAMDRIVQERPELTIFSGLCLQFPPAANSPLARGWTTDEDLGRSGVHWLSALARLEVAAMLAGHTPRHNPISGYLLPKPDEREPYLEFLRDAVLFHAYSLEADTSGQTYSKADALAYERRVTQAERITALFYQLTQNRLPPGERTDLAAIQKQLARIGSAVRSSLATGLR